MTTVEVDMRWCWPLPRKTHPLGKLIAVACLTPLFLLTLGPAPVVRAQGSSEHKLKAAANFVPQTVAPGDSAHLKLTLEVEPEWTIYDPEVQGGSIPTTVAVEADWLTPAGKAKFPPPKQKSVEYLEHPLLYHQGKFDVDWDHKVAQGATKGRQTVRVKIRYQACNDRLGICDRPRTLTVEAVVDVGEKTNGEKSLGATTSKSLPGLDSLSKELQVPGTLGSESAELEWTLEVQPRVVRRGENATLFVRYEVPSGHHIYSPDSTGFVTATTVKLDSSQAVSAGPVKFPQPTIKEVDSELTTGSTESERWLQGKGTLELPFYVKADVAPGALELKVTLRHQVCTETSCYPPAAPEKAASIEVSDEPPIGRQGAGEDSPPSSPSSGGLWLFLLSAVGWGLFTLLMPCTYPMIPITISYFAKQAEKSHSSVFPLALCYGTGIVLDFVLIGVFIGAPIVQFAQSWKLNLILAALFVVFALSLFGLFEIRLPGFFSRLSGKASQKGGYIGVFLLGATLVITSFTCTAPFVGALLGTGANLQSTGTILLGMGVFGATIALPFVGLSMFPSAAKKLPKSGEWMRTLKVSLGFLELAAALKFLSNVDLSLQWQAFPKELFLLMWTAIAAVAGVYLLGLVPLKTEQERSIGPLQLSFAILVLLFASYCVYGVMGNRLDFVMQAIVPPYSGNSVEASSEKEAVLKGQTPWILVKDDFAAGIARAKEENLLALINWTGVT